MIKIEAKPSIIDGTSNGFGVELKIGTQTIKLSFTEASKLAKAIEFARDCDDMTLTFEIEDRK